MHGVLNILKPPGPTSHDVVRFVRKTLGVRKAGHTGTLDPGAAGVLPVCVGRATRISEYLLGSDKGYRAVMVLGLSTDTYDAQGKVTRAADAAAVSEDDLRSVLQRFQGVLRQVPPMVSAVKHQGERLYQLARQGKTVERPARVISVHTLDLISWHPGRRARAILDIVCSKGTYVRSLCHEIGESAGCGAYLDFLVRTRHGPFDQENSVTLEELAAATATGDVGRYLVPPSQALAFMPEVRLRQDEVLRLVNGVAPASRSAAGLVADGPLAGRAVRLCDEAGCLVAVARVYPAPDSPGLVGFRLEKVLGRDA